MAGTGTYAVHLARPAGIRVEEQNRLEDVSKKKKKQKSTIWKTYAVRRVVLRVRRILAVVLLGIRPEEQEGSPQSHLAEEQALRRRQQGLPIQLADPVQLVC